MHTDWEKIKLKRAYKKFKSSKNGITEEDALLRLDKHGPNEIKRTRKISPLKIFLTQFTSPLILILIAAAIVSMLMGLLPGAESNFIEGNGHPAFKGAKGRKGEGDPVH